MPSVSMPSSSMLLTTYQRDYICLSPLLLQSAAWSSGRSSAERPPAGKHTALHVPWPLLIPHFYRTTNSTYGSFQSPLFSTVTLSLQQRAPESLNLDTGLLKGATESLDTELLKGAAESLDSGHLKGAAQSLSRDTGLLKGAAESRHSGPLLGLGVRGQLVYVFGEAVKAAKHMDKKAEAVPSKQRPLEEGVIVVSPHVGVACCEDFLQSVCREAGLDDLLQTPHGVTHITCTEWERSPQWQPLKRALAAAGTK